LNEEKKTLLPTHESFHNLVPHFYLFYRDLLFLFYFCSFQEEKKSSLRSYKALNRIEEEKNSSWRWKMMNKK